MTMQPDLDALRRQVSDAIQAHWKMFLIQGLVLVALGFLAVALPQVATLAIEILVGWLFLIGGVVRAVAVLRGKHVPGYGWSLLVAALAVVFGLVLLVQPAAGVLTLTTVLIVFFVIEGIAAIVVALQFRPQLGNWIWILLSGIVDLVIAYLIGQGWPSTATWAIGLLVGINMLFLGLSLVMTALAARSMTSPKP
ncbi:MAG: HdeD family acid-resistance protein [Alphaproteobacteria bacterium]